LTISAPFSPAPALTRSQLRLLDAGTQTVILKMGADGCLYARGSERIRIPALPADVTDTTGAGDCWNAGFIAGLAYGEEALTAAKIGNACAAFCIESVGGSSGVPAFAGRAMAGDPMRFRQGSSELKRLLTA
jgi:sugar/nucleoside kinase (ribokinase family)